MNILLTIACRGGSKGVKNKNIRDLLGKPLIAHTIEQAQNWGRATKIVVSTDSPEIAEVAKKAGALVPFERPAELATDAAGKLPVIRHALNECEKIYGERYDLIVDLDATSPLRHRDDLENCYKIFTENKLSTLYSVVKAHKNPYFNMVELDSNGRPHLCKQLPAGVKRRQDAPPVYNMNASIYFYARDFLKDEKNVSPFSDNSMIYEMDELSAFDIDREIDFQIVELILSKGLLTS